MELTRYTNADAFYEAASPFLLEHEADHCLILGLTKTIQTYPDRYPDPYFVTVTHGDQVIATGLRTPPYPLTLSHISGDARAATELIARDARAIWDTLPAVTGPAPYPDIFAALWKRVSNETLSPGRPMRIYKADRIISVTGISGSARPAQRSDRDLLVKWFYDFGLEALPEDNPTMEGAQRAIDTSFDMPEVRGYWVWEDEGKVVSMAGYTGPTPNGIRVIAVYTPPEQRGHGYASGCVAAMSQWLLDQGRKFCYLFTDLGNPTSNHIYIAMGYVPVCDFGNFRLAEQTKPSP